VPNVAGFYIAYYVFNDIIHLGSGDYGAKWGTRKSRKNNWR
jgi:hypothetical protein